jgi:nucleoside-diphosphate-sugar epimerase
MASNNLLVTGITGHTGGHFLNELIRHKYEGYIRCIVRNTSNTALIDNSGLNIEKVIGDLEDEYFLNESMKDINTVLHIYSIHQSLKILKAAIANNVKRVIMVHTTGMYSKYKSAAAEYITIEKKVTELAKGKIEVTILRPTMIYGNIKDGNLSTFIKIIDRLKIIPMINGGKNLIQPVYAGDLAKAYYYVLVSKNKAVINNSYDVTGEPMELIDMFEIIAGKLGKKRIYFAVPLWLAYICSVLVWIISFTKVDLRERVQRMGEDRAYSHESATCDFGYRPVPFQLGIQEEINEYIKMKKLGYNPKQHKLVK